MGLPSTSVNLGGSREKSIAIIQGSSDSSFLCTCAEGGQEVADLDAAAGDSDRT